MRILQLLLGLCLCTTSLSAQIVTWDSTRQGSVVKTFIMHKLFVDSVLIYMVPSILPPSYAVLPPYVGFPLDTINILTDPSTGQLRSNIIAIDTTQPWYGISIDRSDTAFNRTPYRIWVHNWPSSDSLAGGMLGAFIVAPTYCPIQTVWDAPMFNVRWAPLDTNQDPNILTNKAIALAAAAQLPISALRDMTKLSLERFLRRSITQGTPWAVGNQIYLECFGTLPP